MVEDVMARGPRATWPEERTENGPRERGRKGGWTVGAEWEWNEEDVFEVEKARAERRVS